MPNPDLQKHTLHLYSGDYERISEIKPDVPAAAVIRELVRAWIASVESHTTLPTGVEVEL